MKSKTIIAAAVAGLVWSFGASANDMHTSAHDMHATLTGSVPMNISEAPPSLSTIQSLDTKTGGYKGWGPMANPQTPYSVSESKMGDYTEEMRERQQQLAEVKQVREQVWVANAPLRAEYENIGATRSQAGGFGGFFHRDSK